MGARPHSGRGGRRAEGGGGKARARFDGVSLWHDGLDLYEYDRARELLVPMLINYPAVPAGYDGWWAAS